MSIEARNISKTFGSYRALRQVDLHVPTGELVALVGPSGSGKTTFLRIIAGLEAPDPGSGPILFDNRDASERRIGERRVGFVFQHYALFRHMSVFENVAFGLRARPAKWRPSRTEIARRVNELLELVQLDGMAHRLPSQLSGGQRQRVALARALAVEPRVLLLDEPFGALDARVRQELRRWVRRLHDEIHLTSVFVTHDDEEALELADRVVVMNDGKIEQMGTPDEVFHKPANEFVMHFLGRVNLFRGRIESGKPVFGPGNTETNTGSIPARLFVRPHEIDIVRTPGIRPVHICARVERVQSAGPLVKVELIGEGGEPISVEMSHERFRAVPVTPGDSVYVVPREVRTFFQDGAGI